MEEINKIPAREEIPEADKWAIEDLYPTEESWERELETLTQDRQELESFAGKLGQDGKSLYRYLKKTEEVNVKADRLGNYCMRRSDEDTRDAN